MHTHTHLENLENKLLCSSVGLLHRRAEVDKEMGEKGAMIKAHIVSAVVDYRNGICIRFRARVAGDYRKILGDSLTLMNMYPCGSLYSSALDSHYS